MQRYVGTVTWHLRLQMQNIRNITNSRNIKELTVRASPAHRIMTGVVKAS